MGGKLIKKENLMYFGLFIFGVLRLFSPPVDPDFGWHFKYGEYFWRHFAVLRENIFSYTLPQYKWNDSYWLFEAVLYFIHNNFGHILGGLILSAILSAFLLSYIKTLAKNHLTLILVVLFLANYLGDFRATVRPHFFSIIFMLVLLYVLLQKPKSEKLLPFLFLLWANFHAEFVIGLFVYGIYILHRIYVYLKKEKFKFSRIYFRTLIETCTPFALSFGATLINPYGFGLWKTLFSELILPFRGYVNEWRTVDSLVIQSMALIMFIVPSAVVYARATKNYWYAIAAVLFGLLMFRSVYMTRVFIILGTPGLIWFLDYLTEKYFQNRLIKKGILIVLCIFLVMAFAAFIKSIKIPQDNKFWAGEIEYPTKAVDILARENPSGNLFNSYRWGGYLIWKLPQYKTFADGRMTSWQTDGNYFMDIYYKIHDHPYENTELVYVYFRLFNIRHALVMSDSQIAQYLIDKGWETTYKDNNAMLLELKEVFANR